MKDTFERFRASEMFCPRCRRSQPVREQLLLIVPGTGQIHDLRCGVCGEPVGTRTEQDDGTTPGGLVVP